MKAPQTPPANAKRIVIKLGTQLMIDAQGQLNKPLLVSLAAQVSNLIAQGKECLIVSSGAVGLGRQQLKDLKDKVLSINEKQACAAVGQSILMETYRELFALYKLNTAQVLVTAENFSNRQQHINLQHTLEELLSRQVVPIINENDAVSTLELENTEGSHDQEKGFGDNDRLCALVASKLNADVLLILTNVDGIFTDNPNTNTNAQLIRSIKGLEALQTIKDQIKTDGHSAMGRGGMVTKLEAARIATISNIYTCITNGLKDRAIEQALSHADSWAGTWVSPAEQADSELNDKKRWIGLASGFQGKIIINAGAKTALINQKASLLPIGIISVEGSFPAGEVVSVQDDALNEIGRGLVNFSSEQLTQFKGLSSEQIANLTGQKNSGRENVGIFRENLVIFESCY